MGVSNQGGIMKQLKTQLGFLFTGDIFILNRNKYKVGHVIKGTNGYVACIDIDTHKVTRIHIDTNVEVEYTCKSYPKCLSYKYCDDCPINDRKES